VIGAAAKPISFKPLLDSALARLIAALGLVDDEDAALAADDAVVAMAPAQGLQRVANFHGLTLNFCVSRPCAVGQLLIGCGK
jgi:hypothetical protein